MNHLLIYLLEASICLGVFYLFYMMVLHDQPSHQYNRLYLLLTSSLSFILPLLQVPVLFGERVSQVTGGYQNYILLDPAFLQSSASEGFDIYSLLSWQNILLLIYCVGVLLNIVFYTSQAIQLARAIRQYRSTFRKGYRLIYTEGKLSTASFFGYLFWDNTQKLTQKEAAQIIAHEEAHISQKHSYDVLYMAVLKTLFWFHPLVHLYERALVDVHEFAADANALGQHHPSGYARLLTRRMFAGLQLSLVNHFYTSRTLKRIKMMHISQQQTPRYKLLLSLPLFLALFVTFSCEPDLETTSLDQLKSQYDQAQTMEERMLLPDAEEVFMVVEAPPEPEGGIKAFYQYVAQSIRYPSEARRQGIEGKVFVQFVVDKNGELTSVEALKGIGKHCDEEAIRVIESAPAWKPGRQRGRAVKVRMVLPITFKLDDGKNNEKKEPLAAQQAPLQANLDEMVVVGL